MSSRLRRDSTASSPSSLPSPTEVSNHTISREPKPSYLTLLKLKPEHLALSHGNFLRMLYDNFVTPTPECTLCRQAIQNPENWMSFVCNCQVYYHKTCVYDSLKDLVCTKCKDSKNIYTFNKFPAKFLTEELYYKIYQNTIADLPVEQHLKVYRLWFGSSNSNNSALSLNYSGHDSYYTPPLLDLYTYIEPHNPDETMRLLSRLLKNHRVVSYDPAIQVQNQGTDLEIVYDTKKIDLYYMKQTMLSLKYFRKKLKEFSYGLIDDQFPFSQYTAIVGGAVHKCLESRIKIDQIPEYCDLDIFICHPDQKILARETRKVIKYFRDKLGDDIYWVVRGNIINLLVPGYNRSLQIILFRNTLPYIVHKFDFSHIQYVYNGKTILTTLAGLEYAKYLVSVHSGYYDIHFPKRFFKSKEMKLCLALPIDKHVTLNLPTVMKIDHWYPSYTDELEKIKQQIRSLYGIHKRFVTRTKPFRIHYTKIPTEFHNDRLGHNNHRHLTNLGIGGSEFDIDSEFGSGGGINYG